MSMATRTDAQSPALHVADRHDLIRVQGARVNNLKDVNVELPKRRLTVFTGLRLRQELAGVRHDRGGVAAAHQRDLQRLRAGLHADPGAAGCRRARRPDVRDPRRPGADGDKSPLHRRHRHRRPRDAAHPLQPAREAAHRLAPSVRLQRALGPGRGVRSPSSAARASRGPRRRPSPASGACARAARAWAGSPTST